MNILFSSRRPKDAELLRAAKTLFVSGGLADYPGPAALLRCDGAVVAANAETKSCATALGLGASGPLHPELAEALRRGVALRDVIDLPVPGGEAVAPVRFEYTLVPIVAGETAMMFGRNTTVERNFRDALVESRQRYKELVRISSDFYWETGADGRFTFVSPGGVAGIDAASLVGSEPASLLEAPATDAAIFAAREPVNEVDVWVRRANGALACFVTTAVPLFADDGTWRGARGICRNVTAMREGESALARAQARERLMAYIVRTVRDEIEPAKMLEAAATATARALDADCCRIFRVDEDGDHALAASRGADIVHAGTEAALLLRAAPDGRPLAIEEDGCRLLCVATSYRERVNGALLLARGAAAGAWTAEERALAGDVALQLGVALAQIRNQLRLEALSRTDGLTGLLNRRAFNAELEQRLARGGATGALFYVDLDNFKPVNDVLGHQKGDEALRAVARMLADSTRPGDLVARLGGDEFALWLERTDEDAAGGRAQELLDASSVLQPYSGDPARPLGISVGVAVFEPGGGETPEALTLRADEAMYEIKHNGKAGYVIAPAARRAPAATERRTA